MRGNGRGNGKDHSHSPLRNGHDPNFIPPSADLEQYLLAALLTDNRRLDEVGALQPEHFGYEAHGRIFSVIRHLVAEKLPATPQTMTYMIAGDPNLAAKSDYLATLARSVVSYTPYAVAHWADELIALSAQRSLLALGNDLGRIFLDSEQPSFVDRVEGVFSAFDTLRGKWRRDHAPKDALAWLDYLQLEDDPELTRQWLVPGWLPIGETCGLGGAGGEGKTLLAHQLATVAALGYGQWLGMPVTPMKAALLLCEDNTNDAHWRQVKINRLYGCTMPDLDGQLLTLPRREADNNYLAVFDKDNEMTLTPLFHQLLDELKSFGAKLIVLDTLFDVFNGDQNNPIHARKFVRGCCDRIAREVDGIVILVYHPSVRGTAEGDYQSGSVQWNSAYRARLILGRPLGEAKEDDDTADTRTLSLFKTNFGPSNEAIKIIWKDGAFVRKPEAVDDRITAGAESSKADRVLEQFFRWCAQQGRNVSNNTGPTYAPAIFAHYRDREGVTKSQFSAALDRAIAAGKVRPDEKTSRLHWALV